MYHLPLAEELGVQQRLGVVREAHDDVQVALSVVDHALHQNRRLQPHRFVHVQPAAMWCEP